MDIRIIREPTVYLLGRQTIDRPEGARFLADHGFIEWRTDSPTDAETLVEVAARTCYQSFRGGRPHAEHLRHLLEVGHGSTVEHAVWNLLITGVSRSLTHELVRHRAGMSFSQLSQRYVDESVAEYVEPAAIAADPELHALWLEAVGHAHAAYVALANRLLAAELGARLSAPVQVVGGQVFDLATYGRVTDLPADLMTACRKAARQAARSILPNCTETKIFVTANARALRHFIEMRASRHAEVEIRKLAVAVLRLMQKEAPNLFSDYQLVPLGDGTFEATTPHRKV